MTSTQRLPTSLQNAARLATIGGDEERPLVYGAGNPSPANLRPRPVDQGKLSFRDSLSNPWPLKSGQRPVFEPGDTYFGIDASRQHPGSLVKDDDPPGHVFVT